MPAIKRPRRNARHWGPGHFQQLADFHDFFGDGWGRITDLPELQLREVVADMSRCWQVHKHDVFEECGRTHNIWFHRYAEDPEKLIAEILTMRGGK